MRTESAAAGVWWSMSGVLAGRAVSRSIARFLVVERLRGHWRCGGASRDSIEAPPIRFNFQLTYGVMLPANISPFTAPGIRESVQEKRNAPEESAQPPA